MTRRWGLIQLRFSIAASIVMMGVMVGMMAGVAPAQAASHVGHHRRSHHHHVYRASGPVVKYHAALLEDADTGRILYADNPNLVWPPASMAKMTLLLVANEQIAAGRVSYNTPVRISER